MVVGITERDLDTVTKITNLAFIHPDISDIRIHFPDIHCFDSSEFERLFPEVEEKVWEDEVDEIVWLPPDTNSRIARYQEETDPADGTRIECRELIIQPHLTKNPKQFQLIWRCNPVEDNADIHSRFIHFLSDLVTSMQT